MRRALGLAVTVALGLTGLVAGVPRASGAGTYTVSIANAATVAEGAPSVFTVSSSPAPNAGDSITVAASTANGIAIGGLACNPGTGPDYTSQSLTVTLTNAAPTATISVPTCTDTTNEFAEDFFVNLTNPSTTCAVGPCAVGLGSRTARGIITDVAPAPTPTPVPGPTTLSAEDAQGPVGPAQNCIFNVNRDGLNTGTTTVNFTVSGKSSRIVATTGTLTFNPGETVKQVFADILHRPRHQKFAKLTLSNPIGAVISEPTALCQLRTRAPHHRHPRGFHP